MISNIAFSQLIKTIFERCSITYCDYDILISCSQEDYFFLIRRISEQEERLQDILNTIGSPSHKCLIVGIVNSETRQVFSVRNKSAGLILNPMIDTNLIHTSSVVNLVAECLSYDGACGIVLMDTEEDAHKGVFSNSLIHLSSNVSSPNKWVGLDMSLWWPDDELRKYMDLLKREGVLVGYEYNARLMGKNPGEPGKLAHFKVDARIVSWHGHNNARIVKTISCDPLS